MRKTDTKFIAIGFVVLFLRLSFSYAGSSEVNNPKMITKNPKTDISERTEKVDLTEEILSRLDILLGFVLGLSGTIFVDYLRKRKKMKTFREGMRTELRLILTAVNALSINNDCNITKEKVRAWITLSKEFDLSKVASPLADHSLFETVMKRDFKEEDLVGFINIHADRRNKRNKAGNFQNLGRLSYSFIQNNISSLSLLPKGEQAILLNVLRRLDAINQKISSLDFSFEKSYDSNVNNFNLKRLRQNYLSNCQFISDFSYAAAKEISHILR